MDQDPLVGRNAMEKLLVNPLNTIWSFKRFIGRQRTEALVNIHESHLNYKLGSGHNGEVIILYELTNATKSIRPEEIGKYAWYHFIFIFFN